MKWLGLPALVLLAGCASLAAEEGPSAPILFYGTANCPMIWILRADKSVSIEMNPELCKDGLRKEIMSKFDGRNPKPPQAAVPGERSL